MNKPPAEPVVLINELGQVGLKDPGYHTNAFMLQALIYNSNAEKLAIDSQAYNEPTKKNILKVYEEIETKQVFGAPEIERVLKCSASTTKNVMKKSREIGVVEEVKGKYTFISDFNYVKKINEAGTNH